MYQEEIFSNVITDAKKENFSGLQKEISCMEIALERFFTKIFETTSSLSERDFSVTSM